MAQQTAHAQWALDLVVEIDRHRPGFCGEFFRASAERRQVIAAYLSAQPPAEARMGEVGQFLLAGSHDAILSAAYETVPQGFRRALRRSGSSGVQKRPFFALLYRLLAAPEHKQVTRCVASLESLDFARLIIIQKLPQSICRANVVGVLSKPSEAADIVTAMHLLVARGVSEEALAQSIRNVRDASGISRAFRNALLKANAPAHPIPAAEGYLPIRSGEELHSVSREFRNCLRSYATRFMEEGSSHAFAVVRVSAGKGVAHLIREGERWNLEGLYAPRNGRPPSDLREWVKKYLASHGVNVEDRYVRKSCEWDSVRRLTDRHMLDFDFD